MKKIKGQPLVLTANDLHSGACVWRTREGDWSAHLADAQVLTDSAQAERLLAEAERAESRVLSPHLTPVVMGERGPRPARLRDLLRHRGPSAGGAVIRSV